MRAKHSCQKETRHSWLYVYGMAYSVFRSASIAFRSASKFTESRPDSSCENSSVVVTSGATTFFDAFIQRASRTTMTTAAPITTFLFIKSLDSFIILRHHSPLSSQPALVALAQQHVPHYLQPSPHPAQSSCHRRAVYAPLRNPS